jgi:hypothetical protein
MSNLPPPIQLATSPKKEPARQIKDETAIIAALEKEAKRYLSAQVPILGSIKRPIECWECEIVHQNKTGYTKKQVKSVCIYSLFGKLFETTDLIGARLPVVNYIFHHIVGYSNFFACPVIILRDRQDRVVDICFYRPRRPDRELPKYLYKPVDKKPAGRGKYFLYPFQKETERLIARNDIVFIGEGLKNALNALVYEIPYITIEGAANRIEGELGAYISDLLKRKEIVAAFDGDEAGQRAYGRFCERFDQCPNLLEFTSGQDFTDHINDIYKETLWATS